MSGGVFEYPAEVVYERVAAHKALVAERDRLRDEVERLRAVVETEPDPTCTADWCCTACRGTGWAGQDPCSDCYGTGHPHPTTEPLEAPREH